MCTCLIAGRNATRTGRVMLAANGDWDDTPAVVLHAPRARHEAGESFVLTGGGLLPQPEETWGYVYTAFAYAIGTLDRAWIFGLNDRGVAAAGTGASAFKEIPCAGAALEPDDVLRLLLERAESARDGIRMIGELTARYGMRPSGLASCASMATYAVADRREGWFLEMAPGNHWIAQRVPDDEAAMRANAFGIHDADLTDPENVMASPGLADYARARGWWDGDDRHFDFAGAYGAEVSPNEWGPELDPMNMRRRWRAMCLLSGKTRDEDAPEYAVRPAKKLALSDLTDILRDVYRGTAYDLTTVPAAGPWGDPFHDDPASYSLCRRATDNSIAADFSPPGQPVMWTALSSPGASAYIPIWADIAALPAVCGGLAPEESLFGEWQELLRLTRERYSVRAGAVREALDAYERAMAVRLDREAAELSGLSPAEGRDRRTAWTREHIEEARRLCRRLTEEFQKE